MTTTTTTTITTVTTEVNRPLSDTDNTQFSYLNGTCLLSAAYNHALQQLFITFRDSENTYRYWDVPAEDFVYLQRAISAGRFYNDNIKGVYRSELFC